MITDETMRETIASAKPFTIVILHATDRAKEPGAAAILWEHVRQNLELRADGLLRVVCPIMDGSALSGVGVFVATLGETARIMDADPAVRAGIFSYEVHETRSFPGDSL